MNEQSGRSEYLDVYEPSFTWFIIGLIFYPMIAIFYYLYKYITFKPVFLIKTSTSTRKRDRRYKKGYRTVIEEDWEEVQIDRDLNTWEIEKIKSARKKLICILIFYAVLIVTTVLPGMILSIMEKGS